MALGRAGGEHEHVVLGGGGGGAGLVACLERGLDLG